MLRVIVFAFCLLACKLFGQYRPYTKSNLYETGNRLYFTFNSSPFLAQAIPANGLNRSKINPSLGIRIYNENNRGFRFNYALGINENNDLKSMLITMDYDNRRSIADRWYYFQGFGGSIRIDSDLLDRFSDGSIPDQTSISLAWHCGFEYVHNQIFSLSIETALRAGSGVSGRQRDSFLSIDAPVNILAHFYLNSEK